MPTYIQFAEQILKDEGYKMTATRRTVLEVLDKHKNPLSPYKIAELALEEFHINIDTVTVYRIIQILEELDLAHKVHGIEGYVRCEVDASKHCHHSFICRVCKNVQQIAGENLDPFIKKIEHAYSITIERHQLEFTGLCKKCTSKPHRRT